MKNIKRNIKRMIAGLLASLAVASIPAQPLLAAAPAVSFDEAMYVKLDYYGKVNDITVVKGGSLNGNSEFTDYGAYSKVTNMSNAAAPELSDSGVRWKLPEGTGRFYFECTPKSKEPELPWSIDVSYRLNGVPTDAKKLAGAAGLVEIGIKVTPNKGVSDYEKNNMLLQCGTVIDMSDELSVEAPGAQVQSLGEKKAVLFSALPGEETTFTIRIGTKGFESDGIYFMVVPGTLEQMKNIKEIKEDKDTVEDSVDAINESTGAVLQTIESMAGGLDQVKSGLFSLNNAHGSISSSRDGLFSDSEKSLADISAVAEQTAALVPHLQNAQTMAGELNGNVNELVSTMDRTKEHVASLGSSLKTVGEDVETLRGIMEDVKDQADSRNKLVHDMRANIGDAEDKIDDLQVDLGSMSNSLTQMSTLLAALQPTLEYLAGAGDTNAALFAALFPRLKNLSDSANGLIDGLEAVFDDSEEYLDTARNALELSDTYFDLAEDGIETTTHMLEYANKINASTQSLLELNNAVIDKLDALNGTMNKYHGDSISALKDTEVLTGRIKEAIDSSEAFLSSFEATLKAGSGDLDEGAENSLNGMIDVLEKSLTGISRTPAIEKANNTIKKTIDKEVDKYEKENNLLNLDAEARPVSFTSSQNPAPDSIQIVMRTEEISLEDDNGTAGELEKPEQDIGFAARVRNLFIKIWTAIASVFGG